MTSRLKDSFLMKQVIRTEHLNMFSAEPKLFPGWHHQVCTEHLAYQQTLPEPHLDWLGPLKLERNKKRSRWSGGEWMAVLQGPRDGFGSNL